MNGKSINSVLSDKKTKIIGIDSYIKKSLAKRFVLLFIISIIPFAISSYIIKSYEVALSFQKSKLAFEAKKNLVVNKIENSIQQIAHTNGFRMYIQSSDISRAKDKYKLLNKIEISLLHNPLIEGIELFTLDQKKILQTGEQTSISVIYNLKYTNDFIDEFGSSIGTLKAFLNKDALIEEYVSDYYDIYFTNHDQASLPIIGPCTNNLFLKITTNDKIKIQPRIEHSNNWLIYIITILVLLIMYFLIIKKIFSRISEPIKHIENTAFTFSTCSSTNPSSIKIKELLWIKKIIDNIKIAKNNTTKNTNNKSEKQIKSFINTLHSLKSNISSIKMIADNEVSNKMLNERIINTLNNAINSINEYKQSSNNVYQHSGFKFISVAKLIKKISKYSNSPLIINHKNNISVSYSDYLVPLSLADINLLISNISINVIESKAINFFVEYNYTNNKLIIEMSNDGEKLDLDNAYKYLSGKSTKSLGTGTGISSLNRMLKSINSTINFIAPKSGYNTTVRIELTLIENNVENIINNIKSKITLSEIIIVNNIVYNDCPDDILVTKMHSDEVCDYIELSRKSGILENQLYVHDVSIFISNSSYNAILLKNGHVTTSKRAV